MIRVKGKRIDKVIESIAGDDDFTPSESDLQWQQGMLSVGPSSWLTTYAMYNIDRDTKTITLASINLSDPEVVTISRIRKVCELLGWKHRCADKVKVHGIFGVEWR
jgi:hypothetical protein